MDKNPLELRADQERAQPYIDVAMAIYGLFVDVFVFLPMHFARKLRR